VVSFDVRNDGTRTGNKKAMIVGEGHLVKPPPTLQRNMSEGQHSGCQAMFHAEAIDVWLHTGTGSRRDRTTRTNNFIETRKQVNSGFTEELIAQRDYPP